MKMMLGLTSVSEGGDCCANDLLTVNASEMSIPKKQRHVIWFIPPSVPKTSSPSPAYPPRSGQLTAKNQELTTKTYSLLRCFGVSDLLTLLANRGNPYGTSDLLDLLFNWGPCP